MNFTTPGRVALFPGYLKLFPFAELKLFFAMCYGKSGLSITGDCNKANPEIGFLMITFSDIDL